MHDHKPFHIIRIHVYVVSPFTNLYLTIGLDPRRMSAPTELSDVVLITDLITHCVIWDIP